MKASSIILPLIAGSLLFASCTSRDDEGGESIESAGLTPDTIHRAVTLEAQGQTDAALALLLDDADTVETAVTPLECLGLSESDFLTLNAAQQRAMSDQIDLAGRAARALGRAALTRAAEVREAGKGDKADRWTERVDAMGRWLASDAHSSFLNLFGDAIQKDVASRSASGGGST